MKIQFYYSILNSKPFDHYNMTRPNDTTINFLPIGSRSSSHSIVQCLRIFRVFCPTICHSPWIIGFRARTFNFFFKRLSLSETRSSSLPFPNRRPRMLTPSELFWFLSCFRVDEKWLVHINDSWMSKRIIAMF